MNRNELLKPIFDKYDVLESTRRDVLAWYTQPLPDGLRCIWRAKWFRRMISECNLAVSEQARKEDFHGN